MLLNISILIVTRNQRGSVLRCLEILLDKPTARTFEVLLYDNASADHTVKAVLQKFPWVKVFAGGENVGFAQAANRLFSYAQGEHCLLLNPDVEMTPETIEQLCQYLQTHPRVGIVGPRLQSPAGRWEVFIGRFPTPGERLREFLFLNRLFSNTEPPAGPVDWLAGTVMLFPRDLAHQLGPFDEQFFLYFEDVDLCRRVWAADREVHYLPEAVATHEERAGRWFSSRYFSAAKITAYSRSEILYFRKWWPSAAGWVRGVLLLRSLLRGLAWVFLGLLGLGGPRKAVGERVKGYWISTKIALMG